MDGIRLYKGMCKLYIWFAVCKRKCFGTSSCDHVTGKCDDGCDRGYQSEDCTASCDSKHYGVNCESLCEDRHCNGEQLCHTELGYCNGGCLTGWTGLTCVEGTLEVGILNTTTPHVHLFIPRHVVERKQSRVALTVGVAMLMEAKPMNMNRSMY
ncbi:multiple epidermal growth factor-like domains protein 10 [Gigantopelta aegis]|uniref:multiple epidermal growth factor-like domains protein 10 n=1 Tax=Gigantopelta aegis TaxID=1735272 RepID=UPI001B88BDDB|nr:multiple epidermal growth factor-like domains protein 10 [Gigantopelta aegis]